MLDSEKLAIAAHLHVVMRRKIGRVTDVEWMVRNVDYAKEVVRLALAEVAHPELVAWGERLQAAVCPAPVRPAPPALPPNPPPAPSAAPPQHTPSGFGNSLFGPAAPLAPTGPRYVGRLR